MALNLLAPFHFESLAYYRVVFAYTNTIIIACICIHHFENICLSETYVNSDISSANENLDIPSFRLAEADLGMLQHP